MTSEPDQVFAPLPASSAAAPARARDETRRSSSGRRKKLAVEPQIRVHVHAALVAVVSGEPLVCIEVDERTGVERLPVAEFVAGRHRDLEQPLQQKIPARVDLGAAPLRLLDCKLADAIVGGNQTIIDVTYLGLVAPDVASEPAVTAQQNARAPVRWQSLYMKLPWEDWRHGRPSLLDAVIAPLLQPKTETASARKPRRRSEKAARRPALVDALFPRDVAGWDTTRVPERYDLLAAAGALPDATLEGAQTAAQSADPRLGAVMAVGDRRRLALALGYLRTAVTERPAVAPLMPAEFTLFELQRCVEAVLGPALHKQNFRRQLETQGLLEPLGRFKSNTGGRPAQLYRFRRNGRNRSN